MAILVAALLLPRAAFAQPGDDEEQEQAPAVTPPRLLEFVEAEYPQAAQREGLEAAVELELTIAADGLVTEAQVVAGAGSSFDAAALAAARRFVFEPATRDGEAIPARIRYRYVFELRQETPERPDGPQTPTIGRLMGRVVHDDDEDPVAEAEVLLNSAELDVSRRAVTSADGRFRFEGLQPGEYEVRVIADEYGESSGAEEIAANEVTEVVYRMELLRDPSEFGARAVIDAPPREAVRRTITREELTRVPGTRGDALRTVELLPGVGRPPFGAGQLIVRGSAPGDSEVFLDGAAVPLLYHFGGLTSFINSRMLDRIDFFPGNFSARYGRKIGGILEVSTRSPSEDGELHGFADVNLIDASLLLEAPIGEDASFALAARRSYIDFWFENVIPEDVFDIVAAPVYYDYQAFAEWRPSDRDRLRAIIYGSSDSFQAVFGSASDTDPAIRGNLELETQFHRGFLSWKRQLNRDVDQELQVAFGPNLLEFVLGEDLSFDATFWDIQMRTEWTMRLSSRVRVITGLDVNVIPFTLDFRGPPLQQNEGNPSGGMISGSDIDTIDIDGVGFRPAAFVEVDLRPVDPLRIVVGLRLDYYDEVEQWSFDPRIVSILSLDEENRIKAGLGIFGQPPQFAFSNDELGNPNLLPERAVHVGLGYERDLDEGITVGVEGFYKHLWDRVVGTENGLPPRFDNEGIGRIYGLELSGRVQPQGRRWFGFLSYTFSRSERRDREDEPWRLFDFDQTHILSVAGVYRLGSGWEIGATFRLVTGNPETPIVGAIEDLDNGLVDPIFGEINSARSPWFHRLDFRVEKLWTFDDWKFALYLDVQNVYNAANPEGTIYNRDFTERTDLPGLPIIPSLGVRGEL